MLGHGKVRPFTYKTLGVFVDLGRNQAVANMAGLKLSGFPAWWAARTYHLAMMPGHGAQGAADGGLDRRAAVRP